MATEMMQTDPQVEEAPVQEDSMEMFYEKLEELNALTKWFNKQGKAILKKSGKATRRRTGGGQKSGFSVPVKVDDVLARFLNVDPNDHMPRTEVTKRLTAYIKENELQCENKKHFKVDKALADVFSISPGTQTNWFEMQKFLAKLLTSVSAADAKAEDTKAEDTKAEEAKPASKAGAKPEAPGPSDAAATKRTESAQDSGPKKKIKKPTP